jgi:predicted ATPase
MRSAADLFDEPAMSRKNSISKLSIDGFKSIRGLRDFRFGRLNVLLGANGAGKSSFVSYFRMLAEMVEGRLQKWTVQQGGADRILGFGVKETDRVESFIRFGLNGYEFALEPTVDGGFVFASERLFVAAPQHGDQWIELGSGHQEAKLKERFLTCPPGSGTDDCYGSISGCRVFHFHDTSDTAGVKRWGGAQDNARLRPDASNLAACLFRLREEEPEGYERIRKTVRLAIPFFDDFVLKPRAIKGDDEQIRLLWRQKESDYTFWPSQLSDGSLRFICLATALLQPDPPSTIVIDEPELGLHPCAITLLASLLRSASRRMQVIVCTQSVPLVDEFTVDDLVIVERERGDTVFKRFDREALQGWLEDYTLGELWEKNVLGGRPRG